MINCSDRINVFKYTSDLHKIIWANNMFIEDERADLERMRSYNATYDFFWTQLEEIKTRFNRQ